MTKIAELPVKKIVTTAGTLVRPVHQPTKADYVLAWKAHADFPPLDVFWDGKRYLLADGLHRLESAIEVGHETIACKIHEGNKRAALEFALSANGEHGLRRSNNDKRYAVTIALKDKEWGAWSNVDVGKLCNVSTDLARRVRRQLIRAGEIKEPKTIKTTRKGKVVERVPGRKSTLTKSKEEPKSGTSKKRKLKTQDDVAREELALAIEYTKHQPFDGEMAREKKLFSAKDARYMRDWWTEAAK